MKILSTEETFPRQQDLSANPRDAPLDPQEHQTQISKERKKKPQTKNRTGIVNKPFQLLARRDALEQVRRPDKSVLIPPRNAEQKMIRREGRYEVVFLLLPPSCLVLFFWEISPLHSFRGAISLDWVNFHLALFHLQVEVPYPVLQEILQLSELGIF